MNKIRVFGECATAVGLIAIILTLGFSALMALSTQVIQVAGLN